MKFLKNFSICRTDLTKYSPSIIRIIICTFVLIFVWFRRSIYTIDAVSEWLQVAESIIIWLITFGSVWFMIFAVVEMFATYANRKKLKQKKTQTKKTASSKKLQNGVFVAVEDIEKLCLSNDIIEIKIVVQQKQVLIGSSSDCKKCDFNFFDKRYYIEDNEFVEFDLFKTEFQKLISGNKVHVLEIDGLRKKSDLEFILQKVKNQTEGSLIDN